MWKSALGYVISSSNYNITNTPNLYNFIISLLDVLTEEQSNQMIDSLIINMGKTFYKDFRTYFINKLPNSKHLHIVNRIL